MPFLAHYILIGFALFLLFIMFLVLSKTFNNTVNLLIKLEFLFQKEYDLKREALEVRHIMEEQAREQEALEKAKREGLEV
jgi:hypothetical protein